MKVLCMFVLILAVSVSAQARFLGEVSNGEGEVKTEEKLSRYHISCVSSVDNATVLRAPDLNQPLIISNGTLGNLAFNRGADFWAHEILEVDGKQFLAGWIIQYSRNRVFTLEKPDTDGIEEIDKIYVLPKEWDCSLYQGGDQKV